MNKKLFLLDTNIYRRIAEIVIEKRFLGNNFIIAEIKDREASRNCQSIMSLTTSQELLVHMKDGDEDYEECYHALRFQFFHTQIFQKRKIVPSIDSLLSYFFYREDSKDDRLSFTNIVYQLISKIFYQSEDLSNLKSEIENISKDFLNYKNEFYLLFESLLKHPDNILRNWNFFENDKKLKEFIDSEAYIEFIKNYLIERAKFFCKNEMQNQINKTRVIEFEKYFKEAIIHFEYLFDELQKHGDKLKEIMKHRWNTIMDFHIVFEWCFLKYYNEKKQIDVIFVTLDKSKNFKDFKKRNVDCWDLWEYLEFLGFIVDKTNRQEPSLLLNNIKLEKIAS